MNLPKISPRRIFLIDGIGAIVSATFLGLVLPRLFPIIGMDSNTLIHLAIPACFFAVYSLSCYMIDPQNWQAFLKIIALINVAYCVVTLYIMLTYKGGLFTLGYLYFIVEIIIVLSLAWVEWKRAIITEHSL